MGDGGTDGIPAMRQNSGWPNDNQSPLVLTKFFIIPPFYFVKPLFIKNFCTKDRSDVAFSPAYFVRNRNGF